MRIKHSLRFVVLVRLGAFVDSTEREKCLLFFLCA